MVFNLDALITALVCAVLLVVLLPSGDSDDDDYA